MAKDKRSVHSAFCYLQIEYNRHPPFQFNFKFKVNSDFYLQHNYPSDTLALDVLSCSQDENLLNKAEHTGKIMILFLFLIEESGGFIISF